MGKMKLYIVWGSPPVNSVLMTAKALNIELELHEINFEKREFNDEWFLKINPSHTVPTLDDDGFILWDSHAILIYLAETYGKNTQLYSDNIKTRALINQILNFDCGTLFRRFSDCTRPIFYDGKKSIEQKQLDNLKEAYSTLERILNSTKFLAGDNVTIADISVLSNILPGSVILPIDNEEFPKLKSWLIHLESTEFYKTGQKAYETFKRGYEYLLGS
ncbi:glutathione S-transferase 1-like [Sitophilus oryzae]|uniref:Glutathione S-transferase 1-like n=1 Tax=Sitophilus oryzae TaxID=7048 RepID=A0A2S0BZF2_SITOR|nr:glutathione S-transferase 1-like [Sitophilus oryzae]ANS53389.1 glutathione-S-transferase epsilon class 1 [Sitophilus oryzae]